MSEINLKKSLRKAKLKQLGGLLLLTVLLVPTLLFLCYRAGNYFTGQQSDRLNQRLFLHEAVASPNIQTDSQILSGNSTFGGQIISNRSKNLNGYIVPWSTLTSSYSMFSNNLDINSLIPSVYEDEHNLYYYDRQTKQKTAIFYNPRQEHYYDQLPNDLAATAAMENYVAEVAISFSKPLTFKEVQAMIPDDLNIVWLYVVGELREEAGYAETPYNYGFNYDKTTVEEDYQQFWQNLQAYTTSQKELQQFIKENQATPLAELPLSGVMLTGQTQNFAALEEETSIRAASLGATAEVVPYITPLK